MKYLHLSAAAMILAFASEGQANSLRTDVSNNKSRSLMDQDEAVERRQVLHDYFCDRRGGGKDHEVEAYTVTATGQVIDWIDPRSQVYYGVLPSPPPSQRRRRREKSSKGRKSSKKKKKTSDDYDEEEPFELETQPKAMGPSSTVPKLRRDVVADHLSDSELPHCMDDFLCKYGDVHDDDGRQLRKGERHHKFSGAREVVENFGASGYISVWSPYVSNNDHRGKKVWCAM